MKQVRNIVFVCLPLALSFGCKQETSSDTRTITDKPVIEEEPPKTGDIKIPEVDVEELDIPGITLEPYDAFKQCYDILKPAYQCIAIARPLKATTPNKVGKVSGYTWIDMNKNGRKDFQELHAPTTIYLDINNNCARDTGEPFGIMKLATGYYEILSTEAAPFPEGPAIVRVETMAPLNSPDGLVNYKIDLNAKDEFTNVNFAFAPDVVSRSTAPASYGVAEHVLQVTLNRVLGTKARASEGPASCVNDGVEFPAEPLKFGTKQKVKLKFGANSLTVIGWIDFNANGQFEQSERIIGAPGAKFGVGTSTGETTFEFDVPANTTGQATVKTWSRFRYGLTDTLPTGRSSHGEVEDHEVTLSN